MNTDRIAKYIAIYNAAVHGGDAKSIENAARALHYTLEVELI